MRALSKCIATYLLGTLMMLVFFSLVRIIVRALVWSFI